MFHQFKITTYTIIVALAAVLVLPVNAAELQLVIHTGKPHKKVPKFKQKGLTDKKIHRLQDNQLEKEKEECAAKLEVFFDGMIRQGVEAIQNHDRRWAALEVANPLQGVEAIQNHDRRWAAADILSGPPFPIIDSLSNILTRSDRWSVYEEDHELIANRRWAACPNVTTRTQRCDDTIRVTYYQALQFLYLIEVCLGEIGLLKSQTTVIQLEAIRDGARQDLEQMNASVSASDAMVAGCHVVIWDRQSGQAYKHECICVGGDKRG